MLDWTTPHCRHLHRQLSRHTRLYSEMIHANAIVLGDAARHLTHSLHEQPSKCALQLGGSDPQQLANAAQIAVNYGYDEINLNCGCPSPRVQSGNFGACLMMIPELVADCVRAMRDAVSVPITVKHRLGVDQQWGHDQLDHFIGTVHEAGCDVFIAHARIALLKGLSPKENRTVPPLQYEAVYRLKKIFPHLTIVLNGGVQTNTDVAEHLRHVDGVMVGRMAYHQPYWLHQVDRDFFSDQSPLPTRMSVAQAMYEYSRIHGMYFGAVVQGMSGLTHGLPFSRRWRTLCADKPRHKMISLKLGENDDRAFQAWWHDANELLHNVATDATTSSHKQSE